MESVTRRLQETWSTSVPEEIGEVPVRFLGIEITRCQVQGEDRMRWNLNQHSYVKDLLSRYDDGGKIRKIPITRDQSAMNPDAAPPTAEGVKSCQKIIGELLWLVTRTRPDLMFGISRMGASVLKSTQTIQETAKQMRLYLKGTLEEGLRFEDSPEEPINLVVYSDSSFAPESDESHGSFVVMVNGNLMFWRSGRQSSVTLSTAESELTELVESMVAGESVYVIISELFSEVNRAAFCDSQSALAILLAEGGSWRTRHLRLRWAFARQSVLRGDWQVSHLPGERMVADLGTKALASTRLEFLKGLLGMNQSSQMKDENGTKAEKGEPSVQTQKHGSEVATMALRLITMAASLQISKAQDDEDDESSAEFNQLMLIYTVLVMIFTLVLQALWKVGVRTAYNHLRIWLFGDGSGSLPAEIEEPEVKRPNLEQYISKDAQSSLAEDGSGQRVLVQLAQAGRRHAVEETAVPSPKDDRPEGDQASRAEDGSGQRVLVQLAQAGRQRAVEETAAPGHADSCQQDAPAASSGQQNASASGTSGESSTAESGATTEGLAERIEAALNDIAEEEVQLWRDYRSMGRFPYVREDHQAADLGFDVFRTPSGTVYHSTRSCTQLRGPRTGFPRKFAWCELCKEVAMRTRGRPPCGHPLLLLTSGQILHTDSRCPRSENTHEFRGCMYCTDFTG